MGVFRGTRPYSYIWAKSAGTHPPTNMPPLTVKPWRDEVDQKPVLELYTRHVEALAHTVAAGVVFQVPTLVRAGIGSSQRRRARTFFCCLYSLPLHVSPTFTIQSFVRRRLL